MRTWLQLLAEQAEAVLRTAVQARLQEASIGQGEDIDVSASGVVVVAVGGAEPVLLAFSYDHALRERVRSAAFGQGTDRGDEPSQAGALLALTDLLMDGALESWRCRGGDPVVTPAVYCGPIGGRGIALCGVPAPCLTVRTDAGVLTCRLVARGIEETRPEAETEKLGRILVAAESPLVCRMLVRVAAGLGFEGLTASDGEAVLATVERLQPDVVALSMNLGGGGWATCLRRIKEIRPEAKVVLVSTDGRCEGLLAGVVHGACGFVLRPFDGRGFEKQLRRIAALRAGRALTPALQT